MIDASIRSAADALISAVESMIDDMILLRHCQSNCEYDADWYCGDALRRYERTRDDAIHKFCDLLVAARKADVA